MELLNVISLLLIILIIILILSSIIIPLFVIICTHEKRPKNKLGFFCERVIRLFFTLNYILIIRFILLLALLCIFIGFFIAYKKGFENHFFELYDIIDKENEKISLESYYRNIFDLKTFLNINIILLTINVSNYLISFIHFKCVFKKISYY